MGKILFQMILHKSAGKRRQDQLFFPPSAEIKPTNPKEDPPSQWVVREEGVVASGLHAVMTAKAAGIAVRLFRTGSNISEKAPARLRRGGDCRIAEPGVEGVDAWAPQGLRRLLGSAEPI